ncbi:putative cytokinetic ring protein SteA [Actinomyces naeslundii]|uniref:putative cytokinetic ring protein SteA n=1 Tax=Actinomyces naeslundii TaxID=1655 RepID=UPI0028EE9CE7|nr:putative cytokinetic ring protein SteA [Actinomyces naeslundii]
MRNPFRRRSASVSELPSGVVRVDARTKKLTKRLQPGEIAIIDHTDIDRVAAEALVECGPSAVLNASPSISGRYPNLGPEILVDAGIPLIDDLGPDVMRLHDGQRVAVEDGTVRIAGKEQVIAEGSVQTKQTVADAMEAAKKGLAVQLEAFAANTMEYMRGEWDLLLNGVGMPTLSTQMGGRHVLVVVRGYSYKEDLQALKPYIREYRPVIIGVDGGADAVLEAGFKPTMIVGDMDSVSDKALTCGAEVVVHAYRDGRAPGLAHVEELGVEHHVFAATGTSEDIAMLMADEAGAEIIVALGTHATLLEFLDKGRAGMSSTFLTRLKVGGRLIDAKGVSQLYRTRISGWWLLLLALSGTFALAIALMATPAGQTFLGLSGAVWDDVVNFFRSLVGLAPNSPTV